MKKNKLLGFALIGIGVGVGICLVKKHNEMKRQTKKIDNQYDDDDFFNDDDFYCDTESVEVIKDRYTFIDEKSINEDDIQTKDLKENIKEDDFLVELTNCEYSDECVCEKQEENKDENKEENKEEIDELTNQLNKETKEELLKQKEKIVLQREELFRKKRDGILIGKEFKEMKKALGQEEERLNKILAEMKK